MRKRLAALGVFMLVCAFVAVTPSVGQAAPPGPSVMSQATQAISTHPADVRAATGDAYQVRRSTVDANGASHVRYSRTYHGLRVYGGDFVVHAKPDGTYAGMSVGLNSPLSLSTTARTPAASAVKKARSAFKGTVTAVGAPELFVDASSGAGRLAYETVVRGRAPDRQTPSVLHVITDAGTNELIGSFDEIEAVNGTGHSVYAGTVTLDTTLSDSTYTMVDPAHGGGSTCDMNNGLDTCTNFTDADNLWGDGTSGNRQSAGVDAHFGAAMTFDYFKNVHGRDGILGDGSGVPSRVHYGQEYDNAFWDGSQMTYGDGAGNAKPLVSLDVVGHEMSHGVTDALAGLVYSGESGGLNEATSDIFGSMVEFYADTSADPGDYVIGEKDDVNGDGTPLRYLYDPSLDGASQSCWSTSTDKVDVHYSSGVGNHFFFNLAEGTGPTPYGTSAKCDAAPAMTGIGRAKAEQIWYHALDVYFTPTTRYVNTDNPTNTARASTLSAAADLFGLCSAEYVAVQTAWTAVNVTGNDASCPADNDFSLALTPNSGSVSPGGSITATVAATLTNGAAQTVNVTASGLPNRATATFSPSSINSSGGTSTLTIATGWSTPYGTYPVTVIATSAGATRTTTFTLTVADDDFSLTATPKARSITAGGSITATVAATLTSGSAQTVSLTTTGMPTGTTANFSPRSISSDGGTSTLTITTSASTPLGDLWVTVMGSGTDVAEYASFKVTVAGNDFSLAATPNTGSVSVGGSVTATISATRTGGPAQTVYLIADDGLPDGTDATFSPSSITSDGGTTTMTISTVWYATPGTYTITILALGSGVTTTFTLTIT